MINLPYPFPISDDDEPIRNQDYPWIKASRAQHYEDTKNMTFEEQVQYYEELNERILSEWHGLRPPLADTDE